MQTNHLGSLFRQYQGQRELEKKTSKDDQVRPGCTRSFTTSDETLSRQSYEDCTPNRTARNAGPVWSLRQTGGATILCMLRFTPLNDISLPRYFLLRRSPDSTAFQHRPSLFRSCPMGETKRKKNGEPPLPSGASGLSRLT